MQINRLDHVNVRTAQLDAMIAWYVDILGLHNGPRPAFPFAGAWLYAGDVAVVHLIEVADTPGAGSETALKLEHFAFAATDADGFEARLKAQDTPFKASGIAEIGIRSFNIWDPDGNHIHVDFKDAG